MKYIITERQYKLLSEEEDSIGSLENSKILRYNFEALSEDWNLVIRLAKGRPFILEGDVDISSRSENSPNVGSIENLIGVEGDLNLFYNKIIKDLGNLKFVTGTLFLFGCTKLRNLGNLEMVGKDLDMAYTKITSFRDNDSLNKPMLTVNGDFNCDSSDIESLDGLKLVKGDLYLKKTPLSKTTTLEEIRNIPNLIVGGDIYL